VAQWAKAAGIPRRIGTSHRWWHWTTCNERVTFSRKRSALHEAQLNIRLLAPFGIPMPTTVEELVPHIGLQATSPTPAVEALLRPGLRNIILHPLLGSGVGWGLHNYRSLIAALDPQRYHVILTGTAAEAARYRPELPVQAAHVSDAGGQLSLPALIALIARCDALVAASTGPLHLAAALGVRTIGLFSMRRPIFPARWRPIGADAHALVHDPACTRCASGATCDCIQRISPDRVLALLPH
jgi:ADP-heptose:LPS heptosyltransferase